MLRERLTTKVGRVFTKVTTRLEGSVTVRLLVTSENYDEFDEVLALSEGVFFEYSEFRKKVNLEIGQSTEALTAAMARATHLELADSVWVINRGDTKPPSMTDVTWKVTADLFERRTEQYTTL
jgi:hypothetical protein